VCERIGFKGKVLQALDSDAALIQAVRSGLGMAVLPEQIKEVPHENIAIKQVTPSVLFSSTIVWKKNNLSPALKAYLQIVTNIKNDTAFPAI
jgi:DNA-binding transcriptional LysR family regulator